MSTNGPTFSTIYRYGGCSFIPRFEYWDVNIPTLNFASGDAYTHNRRINEIRRDGRGQPNLTFESPSL